MVSHHFFVVSHQGGPSSGWFFIRVVSHQGGLSSLWPLIGVVPHQVGLSSGWSLIIVASHWGGPSSGWSLIRVVSHHCGLSSGWSLIRVVFHQGGLSSGWSLIIVVSHQGGLSSLWPVIRVVSLQGGLSSLWSLRVVSHQGGLLSWWSLTRLVSHQEFHFMISPELIAEALEKYQNMDMETESEPTEECDFSVFDTITSLMGKDITRSIQQRNQSPPDRKETILNNNSHGDAESCQPQLTSPNLRQTQNEVSKEGLGTEGAGSMLETFQPPPHPSTIHSHIY